MLDALAALRACLLRMATKKGSKSVNRSAVGNPSPPEPAPATSPAAASQPDPLHRDKTGDLPVSTGQAVTQPTVDPPISTNPADGSKPATHQPVAVLLLGASSTPIARWYKVPLYVANCLLERGSSLSSLAFVKRKTSAFPASARLKTLRDGSFIELGDDRARLLRKTRRMLNQCGRGDLTVAVRLSNGETIDL